MGAAKDHFGDIAQPYGGYGGDVAEVGCSPAVVRTHFEMELRLIKGHVGEGERNSLIAHAEVIEHAIGPGNHGQICFASQALFNESWKIDVPAGIVFVKIKCMRLRTHECGVSFLFRCHHLGSCLNSKFAPK